MQSGNWKIAGFLAGMVAIPISIAFTPIAITADIVVGIAEASFIAYKGAPGKDIQELLFKKIIASPIQQLLSATIKTIFMTFFMIFCPKAVALGLTSPLWTLNYFASQLIIAALPDSLNHKRINIFINGRIFDDKETNKTPPTLETTNQVRTTPLIAKILDVSTSTQRVSGKQGTSFI